LIQKYIFKPELFEKLEEIFKLLITLSSKTKATEYLEVLLRYLTASIESKKTENLKTEIEKVIKYGGDIMPTIAEKWVKEGKKERDIEICEKLIERSMDNGEIRNITGLSIKKIEEIRKSLKSK
jgi:lysyl-tRNA synthetase class I